MEPPHAPVGPPPPTGAALPGLLLRLAWPLLLALPGLLVGAGVAAAVFGPQGGARLVAVGLAGLGLWGLLLSAALLLARSRPPPGLRVEPHEHARLRALLREAAAPHAPPDLLFTPGADFALLYEQRTLGRLLRPRSPLLLVGLGQLDGLRIPALRSLVCQATAACAGTGSYPSAVRDALATTRASAESRGGLQRPAALALALLQRLLRPLLQPALRQAEAEADLHATTRYGGTPLAQGLRHLNERRVRFANHAGASLREVIQRRESLPNLYAYVPRSTLEEEHLRDSVEQVLRAPDALGRVPADRLRALASEGEPFPPPLDHQSTAWDLLDDPEALQQVMTARLRQNMARTHGITIPGE